MLFVAWFKQYSTGMRLMAEDDCQRTLFALSYGCCTLLCACQTASEDACVYMQPTLCLLCRRQASVPTTTSCVALAHA